MTLVMVAPDGTFAAHMTPAGRRAAGSGRGSTRGAQPNRGPTSQPNRTPRIRRRGNGPSGAFSGIPPTSPPTR